MIQLESFHSITISANLRRLHFIVITDPRNTTVHSVTLEYVANIQGPLRVCLFVLRLFHQKETHFFRESFDILMVQPVTKARQALLLLQNRPLFPSQAPTHSSSLSLPGTHSAAVFNQHSICCQTLSAKNPSTTSHISSQHSFLGNMKED